MAGISVERGLEHFFINPFSIKSEQFDKFITELATKMCADDTVMLDNCSIHKSIKTQKTLSDLKVKTFFNLPYRPDLNAIELFWALAS